VPIPTPQIRPVSAHGKWWLEVTIGDQKLLRKGAFLNEDAAKAAAEKLLQSWTPNLPAPANKDFVTLHGRTVELTSDEGRRFVVDCTIAGEGGGLTDSDIIDKWEVSISEWENIKTNAALGRAVKEEGRRRVSSGQRVRAERPRHDP
jgi:hypothetical protein